MYDPKTNPAALGRDKQSLTWNHLLGRPRSKWTTFFAKGREVEKHRERYMQRYLACYRRLLAERKFGAADAMWLNIEVMSGRRK